MHMRMRPHNLPRDLWDLAIDLELGLSSADYNTICPRRLPAAASKHAAAGRDRAVLLDPAFSGRRRVHVPTIARIRNIICPASGRRRATFYLPGVRVPAPHPHHLPHHLPLCLAGDGGWVECGPGWATGQPARVEGVGEGGVDEWEVAAALTRPG